MIKFARRIFQYVWIKILSLNSRIKRIMWNRQYNKISEKQKFRIVVFLSINTQWDCLLPIYRAFVSSQNSEVIIVADDFPRKSGKVASEFLTEHGYPFVKSSKYSLKKFEPHVIFITDEISVSRNDWLFRIGARVVYIPYGTSVSAATYSQTQQYNLPLHNSAWRIFVAGDFAKNLYGCYCDSGNDHVLSFGHPKTEAIFSTVNNKRTNIRYTKDNPATFLWNIHFNLGGGWSTWHEYAIALLELFASREDVRLICRPHPFFFDSFDTKESSEAVRMLIVSNKNTCLDEKASMVDSFTKCDALITDGSSIMYDFFVTEKPILYLRSNESFKLHKHCFDLIKTYHYIGDDFSRIDRFVDLVSSGNDALRKKRSEKLYSDAEITRPIDVGSNIRGYIEKELKLISQA